jgi:hypothetical protein
MECGSLLPLLVKAQASLRFPKLSFLTHVAP